MEKGRFGFLKITDSPAPVPPRTPSRERIKDLLSRKSKVSARSPFNKHFISKEPLQEPPLSPLKSPLRRSSNLSSRASTPIRKNGIQTTFVKKVRNSPQTVMRPGTPRTPSSKYSLSIDRSPLKRPSITPNTPNKRLKPAERGPFQPKPVDLFNLLKQKRKSNK